MRLRRILRFASVAVLAFGVGAAACIYALVDESAGDATAYPVPPHATKLYARQLQEFGGKAALVFDDLNRWFSGLWHGRALAGTILALSVAVSLGAFLVSRILPPDE